MPEQLRRLWAARELIGYLVREEIRSRYRHKLLGWAWSLVDPLVMVGIYTFVVTVVFERPDPRFPVLVFSALLAWQWFTFSTAAAVTSILGSRSLVQTVDLPKGVFPLTKVGVGLVRYLFGFVVLVPLVPFFGGRFSWQILWLPVLLTVQLLLTAGIALTVAVAGVYFRDLENLVRFGLRFLFFASPILYSAEGLLSPFWTRVYLLNPLASLFESYKNILVRGAPPSGFVLVALLVSLAGLGVGLATAAAKEHDLVKRL